MPHPTRHAIVRWAASMLLLPVLYFLSSGPALYLYSHDWLPGDCIAIYRPISWTYFRFPATQRPLAKWVQFWETLPP